MPVLLLPLLFLLLLLFAINLTPAPVLAPPAVIPARAPDPLLKIRFSRAEMISGGLAPLLAGVL